MFTVQTLKDKLFRKATQGFTLIELMIVITIIAILATIALAGLAGAQKGARDTQRQQMMNAVRAALERYYGDNNAYPTGTWGTAAGLTDLFNTAGTGVLDTYMVAALNDPGCGTAVTKRDVKKNPTPCDGAAYGVVGAPAAGNPGYAYQNSNAGTCTGGGYSLTLTKESGGKSYFCSPN